MQQTPSRDRNELVEIFITHKLTKKKKQLSDTIITRTTEKFIRKLFDKFK